MDDHPNSTQATEHEMRRGFARAWIAELAACAALVAVGEILRRAAIPDATLHAIATYAPWLAAAGLLVRSIWRFVHRLGPGDLRREFGGLGYKSFVALALPAGSHQRAIKPRRAAGRRSRPPLVGATELLRRLDDVGEPAAL